MNILIAEDELVGPKLVENILRRSGYTVTVVRTGVEALARLKAQPYDVLITDWMMSEMDGIELSRRARTEVHPSPIVLMMTSIGKVGEQHALSSGADGFLQKPVHAPELHALLRRTASLRNQPLKPPAGTIRIEIGSMFDQPPLVGIGITTSTGGPDALRKLFHSLPAMPDVAYFVVVHGPDWMQHACVAQLQKDNSALKFAVATHGMIPEAGGVYFAPGDRHLVVKAHTFTLALTDDPFVNFVRPAADPLFTSISSAFGKYAIGVVLTGLGSDGADGAAAIATVGGSVFIQDPATAVASKMPTAALRAVKHGNVATLDELRSSLARTAKTLGDELRRSRT